MNRRELLFGLVGVLGTAFTFWAFWYDRPSREISYYHESAPLVSVEDFGSIALTLGGLRITEGTIYRNRLFIWNSGNKELVSDDFGEPIQWSNAPYDMQWGELPISIDMIFHGIRKDQIEGDLMPFSQSGGLRFKKLYPETGLEITFLTKIVPDISLSGSIGGDIGSSGVVKRQKVGISESRWHFVYALGPIWLGIMSLYYVLIAKGLASRPANKIAWMKEGLTGVGLTLPLAFILTGSIGVWHRFGLPPF